MANPKTAAFLLVLWAALLFPLANASQAKASTVFFATLDECNKQYDACRNQAVSDWVKRCNAENKQGLQCVQDEQLRTDRAKCTRQYRECGGATSFTINPVQWGQGDESSRPKPDSSSDCSAEYASCEKELNAVFSRAISIARANYPGISNREFDAVPEIVRAQGQSTRSQEKCNTLLLACKAAQAAPNACEKQYSLCAGNANAAVYDSENPKVFDSTHLAALTKCKQQLDACNPNAVRTPTPSVQQDGDEGAPVECVELMKRTDKCFTPAEIYYYNNPVQEKANRLIKKYQANNPACKDGLPSFFTCFGSGNAQATPKPTEAGGPKPDCEQYKVRLDRCSRDLTACQNYARNKPWLKEGEDYAPCTPEYDKCIAILKKEFAECPPITQELTEQEKNIQKKCRTPNQIFSPEELITYLKIVENKNPSATWKHIIAKLHVEEYAVDVNRRVPGTNIKLFLNGPDTNGFEKVSLACKNPPKFLVTKDGIKIDVAHSYAGLRSDLNRVNPITRPLMRLVNTHLGDFWQVATSLNTNYAPPDQLRGNSMGIWLARYYLNKENEGKPLSEAYRAYFESIDSR